jgi:hypothetical protein
MVRIFTRPGWLVAVIAALPFVCSAQNKPSAIPVVPAANWRQVDSQKLPLAMAGKFDGETAVEKEYGVKSLELRTYQIGQNAKSQTQVVVEAAPDPSSAYGLFTFYQTPEMTPEKDLDFTRGDANETLMARGSNFIRFLHGKDSPATPSDFHALLLFVGGSKPSANAIASLPRSMPSKGLVPGTEKYLVGLEGAKRALPSFRTDLLGFEQSAEVQLGQYQVGAGKSTLVSIGYPTPQISRIRFGAMSNLLGLNQDHGEASIYGRRSGSYVFLALNTQDPAAAKLLIDQFQVTEGVSWDQKYQTQRSFTLQVVHMILAILLLTAYLIGACVIFGLAFFISKRLAAKYFPDSNWGHTDEEQLIRLNLKN